MPADLFVRARDCYGVDAIVIEASRSHRVILRWFSGDHRALQNQARENPSGTCNSPSYTLGQKSISARQ
jgi:hypothetical protein